MKRRRFIQSLAVAPAASGLLAPQPAAAQTPAANSSDENPKLTVAVPDQAAETVLHFFNPQQFAALRKVSALILPSINGAPGALEAGTPEFLDFLIGASPADRRQVYTAGLDALNAQARKQYSKSFAELDSSQADALLAPLHQPWTYSPPADPLAHFLVVAKQDVLTATTNSREWNVASANGRRTSGTGTYWYPLD